MSDIFSKIFNHHTNYHKFVFTNNLQEQLQAYETSFNQYIQGRVCETSLYQEGRFEEFTACDSNNYVELLIITDGSWNKNVKYLFVTELEIMIAKCLKFDHFQLTILKFGSKCLMIRYAIPVHIADSMFPLTIEEWNQLTTHGIAQIKCLDSHYDGKV